MRLLALDLGDKRIGVAVSDGTGLIASPLTVIKRSSKAADFEQIANIVSRESISALVIGHPLDSNGQVGPQAKRMERYANALLVALRDKGLDLPMIFWDESLSTARARAAIGFGSKRSRKRRHGIDALAAAIILQDYLDEKRRTGSSQSGSSNTSYAVSSREGGD